MPSTVYLIKPISEGCREWIDENIETEPWQWLGGGLAIEHRYLESTLAILAENGFDDSDYEVVS